jgi:two-component system, NarL family, sensor histidine kinase DesK
MSGVQEQDSPSIWRRLTSGEHGNSGLPPILWFVYLGFLFIPFTWHEPGQRWVWATLASLPVFLVLYLLFVIKCRSAGGGAGVAVVLALGLLAFALEPWNAFANTYLVYAAALAPLVLPGFVRPLLLIAALLVVHAAEVILLHQSPEQLIPITVLLCCAVCLGNAFSRDRRSKDRALKLSQDEVHHLATIAERERIGRDLHDLLGHTLSLIAIKGELAGRLLERDAAAAAREITEVTQIARDALSQVRTAVTGMRAAALAGELASARALLESSGVELTCRQEAADLPPPIETALAMIVREAATNIQRHARATRASVEILRDEATGHAVALAVRDNGRGGVSARGNGLAGIGERVRSLGGTLEIVSPPGAGTLLRARLPVPS